MTSEALWRHSRRFRVTFGCYKCDADVSVSDTDKKRLNVWLFNPSQLISTAQRASDGSSASDGVGLPSIQGLSAISSPKRHDVVLRTR